VAGVTFSDSDSAPVSKFLNQGPAIFQIWESDSCSDCGCNHRFNRNLPMFDLKNDHTHSCYCRNWKVTPDPGPVFAKFLTTGPDPGPKEKRRILPESTPDPVLLPASISLSWWMTMKSFIHRISCVNVADLESSEEVWLEKVTKVKLARRFQCMRGS